MAKNRTIPFGYCMKNGEITTESKELYAVVTIFNEYLKGRSLSEIAKLMQSEKIRYNADSDKWNKNMVKRIIENEKYLGTDKYPQIIDDDTFRLANEKRIRKATTFNLISDDLQEIRNRTYCAECGHRLSRIGGNSKYEHWDCRNPDCCKFEYQLTDQMIIGAVLTVMNSAIANPSLLESGGEIIVVDCGMAFPGDDMYGIDCVIPDVSYLVKHKNRIRGMFITHGHEDHIGAVPYILKKVNIPIYCTRLTAGLIRLKLEEHGLLKSTKIVTVESGMTVKAGKFSVEFIHVNHSIADSVAFAIHTGLGTVVHTGDFKIDSTPIDGEVIDLARFGELGKQGVLALLADSTNVERPGYTMSERTVGRTFNRLFQGCKQRIIVTTFASNVHRIQQIMDAAAECGRKVAVTGRSMENVTKVAMDLGYMKPPKNTVVDINKIKSMPLEKQVIVTTGSQGEEMSALYRMAFSQHKQIEVGPGDRVIISASAIPGNENTVSRVINELFRKGVEVIYDRADMLHVSGHACQEELKIIHALTKPKYFIPVHGEQRMLQLHKDLALQMGMDRKNIVICDNGDAVEIGARSMKCVPGYAPAGEVFVDGYGVGDVGAVVLRDRKHLAEDGMVVVVLPISAQNGDLLAEPEIITRGFIYVKDSEELLQDLRNLTMSTAEAYRGKRGRDLNELKGAIRSAVSNYLFKATKRSPMVLPVITKL